MIHSRAYARAPVHFVLVTCWLLAAALSFCREVPRPLQPDARATVHQFGIIRHDPAGIAATDLLPLPSFVHNTIPPGTTATTWLDFSALYFIPPQMTTAPMEFDVRASAGAAWYPYAAEHSEDGITWSGVQLGVQADTLRTDQEEWIAARQMDAAATVKVYKPGPAGSLPDDPGTTEGEVFLFQRHRAAATAPACVEYDPSANTWIISSCSIWSDVQHPLEQQNHTAWLAQSRDGEIISRTIQLDSLSSGAITTPASVAASTGEPAPMPLQAQLNEALTGLGLRPDEAAAQARLITSAVKGMKQPALIYTVSQRWVDARFPLQITGPAADPVSVFAVISALPAP